MMYYVKMWFLAALMMLPGCTTYDVKQEATDAGALSKVPKWYIEGGEDKLIGRDQYIYGVGSSVSSNLQMAIDKATMIAKSDLADQLYGNVNKRTKMEMAEVGAEETARLETSTETLLTNVIADAKIVGYEEWNRDIFITAGGQYRVYIGLKWTRGDRNSLNDLITLGDASHGRESLHD